MNEAEKRKALEKQEAESAKRHLERVLAFKRLFATDDGKVLMKHLEWICNVNRPTYRPNVPDVVTDMRIEEGKRMIHLDILWHLNKKFTEKENEV